MLGHFVNQLVIIVAPSQIVCLPIVRACVAPGFKNKTRYAPYVSPGSQISHITINKGNIKRGMLDI